jgi:hypothetical protein
MSETPQEKAEARAMRRRWLTIGEAVAVAGVVIAGLSWWNGYQERQDAAATRAVEKQAEAAERSAARHRVTLVTTKADDDGVEFKAQEGCPLQSSEIRFPSALGIQPKNTVVTHRIEADWLSKPLLALTKDGPERREGRVPVLIDASCTAEDGERSETAVYDVLWRTEPGGLLAGRSIELRGLVRRGGTGAGTQPALDTLWKGV